jgi:DNA-binding NarL/FixJ family response regulator
MARKVVSHLQDHQVQAGGDRPQARDKLSSREQQVLTQISAGARDREIAARLFVSETTIKTHVRHILRKLGARNRAEAAAQLGTDSQ